MAAAVPPRPSLRVPRPDARTASPRVRPGFGAGSSEVGAAPVAPLGGPGEDALPVESAVRSLSPRAAENDSHQRTTLVHPLGEEDPLDVVMDTLRGVKCLRAVEAASVCLAVVVRAVGCRAAMVHLWDAREESFVIAYALGPNAPVLLNARHGKDDAVLAEAFANRVPRVVNYEGARAALPRHSVVGGAWSVLVAPVMDGDVPLGAIELIDPLDGSCFDDRHIAAARYTTERLVTLLRQAGGSIGKLIPPPAE